LSYDKWDLRFLAMADHVAQWSHGPRTRVGAVIVRPDRTIAATGYNGPPVGFDDVAFLAMPREQQLEIVVHAEINAIASARQSVVGCTLYVTPLHCCSRCASVIVNAGIKRVVSFCGHTTNDWHESFKLSKTIFDSAGVETLQINDEPAFVKNFENLMEQKLERKYPAYTSSHRK